MSLKSRAFRATKQLGFATIALAGINLAVLQESVQRALRQASVPAPLDTSALGDNPLVEMICADRKGKPKRLPPGSPQRIPLAAKDTCRVVLHRVSARRSQISRPTTMTPAIAAKM